MYVVGGIVTVLRLEQPCDSARLAWEGRFEPVECVGKRVLLEPLRDLEPEDRLMLLVTLADGTELPFTVTSRQKSTDDRTGDQQVNVFRDREASKAVLASLHDSLRREGLLREEVERYRKEDSVNLDASAFDSKTGPDRLVLELFRQGDGLRQAWVHLDRQLLR